MKVETIRVVTKIETGEIDTKELKKEPQFKVGDHVLIYSGMYEDYRFKIKRIRYNFERNVYREPGFEYFYDEMLHGLWIREENLVSNR